MSQAPTEAPTVRTADFPQITWDAVPLCEREGCGSDGAAPAVARALYDFPHTCGHATVVLVCDPCLRVLQIALMLPFRCLVSCPRCREAHPCVMFAHLEVCPL